MQSRMDQDMKCPNLQTLTVQPAKHNRTLELHLGGVRLDGNTVKSDSKPSIIEVFGAV